MIKRSGLFIICLVTVLLLAVWLSGCSVVESETPLSAVTATPSSSLKPSAVPTARAGGELVLSMRPPITLNPINNKDASVDNILRLIFEPLIIYDSDFRLVPNQRICKSIDMSFDGLSLVVRLASGAYWSDGERLTAADLIYTLDALAAADDDVIYKKNLINIDSYAKIDDENVRITFKQPFAFAADCLRFPVIPEHYYAVGLPARELIPLGNGAYVFSSLSPVRELRLKRSDNAEKSPYITDIKVLLTPEDSDSDSFRRGIIDVYELPVIQFGSIGVNRRAYEFDSMQFEFIGFNCGSDTWSRESNRKAVAHCLSKTDILAGIYLNHAAAAESPIHPASWIYTDDVKTYEYNLATAKSLYIGGSTTTILVNSENRERMEIAKMLKKNMLKIDVEAEIISLPYEDYLQRIEDGEFDIVVSGFNLSADNRLSWLLKSEGEFLGGNIFGYSDDYMDALLLVAETSVGDLLIKQAYADLQKRIADKLPFISLVFRKDSLITAGKVYGAEPLYGNIFGNISDWFIFE